MRRVVQLKGGELQRQPVRRVARRAPRHDSGRPMLPAVSARSPPPTSTWAISDVVVVLPLVPVMPMQRCTASATKPDVDLGVDLEPGLAARPRAPARPAARRAPPRPPPPGRSARGRARRPRPAAPALAQRLRPALVRLRPRPCRRRRPECHGARSSSVAATPLFPSPTTATSCRCRQRSKSQLRRQRHRTLRVESATSAHSRPRM